MVFYNTIHVIESMYISLQIAMFQGKRNFTFPIGQATGIGTDTILVQQS